MAVFEERRGSRMPAVKSYVNERPTMTFGEVNCRGNTETLFSLLPEGGRLATLYQSFEDVPVRASVRFPLHLDILLSTPRREYRAVTEDVSASGLLFTAEELPAVGAEVKFQLTMPSTIMGGVDDVLLHCIGRIVRHQRSAGRMMAAAIIDEYTLKAEQL